MARLIHRIRQHHFATATVLFLTVSTILVLVAVRQASAPHPGEESLNGVCIPRNLRSSDDSCILLERATTVAQQAAGLGGRESMKDDEGMLFIFSGSDTRCFWMKDMRFSIDMVWLDAEKKIVAKELNVSPDTYPKNYCPDEPAKYVIEVNPFIAKDWKIGQAIPF